MSRGDAIDDDVEKASQISPNQMTAASRNHIGSMAVSSRSVIQPSPYHYVVLARCVLRSARHDRRDQPDHPEPRKIRQAVDALEAGEVIAYPTDTVYGLGCDITNKRAVDRLYQIKGMDRSQPLAMICPDLSEIAKYAIVDNQVYRVLKRFLPGPYCFVLEATREVPRMLQSKRKTIGIRVRSTRSRARS